MSVKTIIAPLYNIHALSLFMPKDDVRYYLNGLAVNNGHMVVTNGQYLAAIPHAFDNIPAFIIPEYDIKKLLKQFKLKQKRRYTKAEKENALEKKTTLPTYLVHIEFDEKTLNGVMRCNDILVEFKAIDGRFPTWKLVVPKTDDTEYHGFYNWEYMSLFSKASKLLGEAYGPTYLKENGREAAKVVIPHFTDFIGVLMPLKY